MREDGHEPVVLARSTGVDLTTGRGLAEALAGTRAVVDVSNVATMRTKAAVAFFEATARHLSRAAVTVGLDQIVALSIVGIDRVPFGYYHGKMSQEQVLAEADVPVTILRATQFHEFAGQYLSRMRGPVLVVPTWRVKPVAAREVGATLASLAVAAPAGRQELDGPREERMADLVRRMLAARGERRRVIEVRLPGAAGRAMAGGGGLPQHLGLRGAQTFDEWLAEQS